MANTVELQATDLFQELDDAELTVVVGGANPLINTVEKIRQSANAVVQQYSVEELLDLIGGE